MSLSEEERALAVMDDDGWGSAITTAPVTLSQQYPSLMVPVRAIPLTRAQVAIIDPDDYPLVAPYSWHAHPAWSSPLWYAVTKVRQPDAGYLPSGKRRQAQLLMETLLTGFRKTDHVNGDGLDNRRVNLRAATWSQNGANSAKRTPATSRFKGVSWHRGHWRASITVNRQWIYLGPYVSEQAAARAYDEAAVKHFGAFARTNKMVGLFPGAEEEEG